jgi:succinoglycan biosynthesis transport protein ExoP
MTQYDLNLRDYWRILRKRKWVIAFMTLAFGAMAFAFAEIQRPHPIYQSTAVVKFERTTTLVGLLVESISVSGGDNMATQAAVVRSFPVLEHAAKILHLIPPGTTSDAIKLNPRYVQLISDLRGQITASPEENTTLINISVKGPDALQTTRIANAVAQAYQEENTLSRNRQVHEARRFIDEQLAQVGERVRQTEESIQALKERRGFVSLPEETTALLTRQTALDTEYEKVRRGLEETTNQLKALETPAVAAGTAPPRIFTDAGDPTIAKLSATLLDLTVERDNLLLTLTPAHPQIRDLSARIAAVRENLVRELDLKRQTFQVRAADLRRQMQEIQRQQRVLPDVAAQNAQLQRELTISESLLTQLRTKLQEVQIKEKEQVEEVTLARPAIEPTQPINPPQTTGKVIVGILIGLTVGLVLAFVLESLDTSIGTIQDVEGYLGIPVLGLIPNIDLTKDSALAPGEDESEALGNMRPFLVSLLSSRSTIAEAYRSLRTNIEFLSLEKHLKTICVTSASLMEGKTTTVINLGVTLAQTGKKVLLVEADLRKPFIHHAFGVSRDPGLAEVIVGNKDWHECLRTVADLMLGPLGVENVMAAPNIDKLSILTSGTPPPNPTEFLNSQRMTDLIQAFRQEFDVVIFDCPPILPVTDAAILASKVDGAVIVYRVGKIARSALRRAKILLENVRGKVLGVVLTGLRAEISPDYEELEYYRYAYGHEPGRVSPGQTHRGRGSRLGKASSLFAKISARSLVLSLLLLGAILAGLADWQWHWASKLVQVVTPWADNALAVPRQLMRGSRGLPLAPLVQPRPPAPANRPSPDTAPTVQASPTPAPPPAPLARGLSLQVASFHSRAHSLKYARTLRAQGLDAFTVPVEIPRKGTWYRVILGSFDSAERATETARDLRGKGTIEAAEIISLPFAVEVVGVTSAKQAARAAALARTSGYLAAKPSERKQPSAAPGDTLRVDAFTTQKDADRLADLLQAKGLSARVIQR